MLSVVAALTIRAVARQPGASSFWRVSPASIAGHLCGPPAALGDAIAYPLIDFVLDESNTPFAKRDWFRECRVGRAPDVHPRARIAGFLTDPV
jgi:hypothetical protein